MHEQAICGLENIAQFIGWSLSTLKNKKDALQAEGILFEMDKGRPPQKHWCMWPSEFKAYTMRQAKKGKKI